MSTLGFYDGLSEAMPQEWLASLAALPGQSEASVVALLAKIERSLKAESDAGYLIYPGLNEVFSALVKTSPARVKTVILGQDPYHGGQAHGLCFSVRRGHKIPPSLRNIFSELADDTDALEPVEGDLSEWAGRGVLLLNSVLTVRAGGCRLSRNTWLGTVNGSDHAGGRERLSALCVYSLGQVCCK